ncbi:MAG: biopolymer transporter ExbD [Myxococcales bacterium]|nr:biopolymer transporter ExbD [Myxococcales bacterium]
MTRSALSLLALASLGLSACDDPPPKKNPFEPPPKETVEPPKDAALPKPVGPPELGIDDLGPKVGFSRVLLDKPEGRDKLAEELRQVKSHFEGKEATLVVIRKAKLTWVTTMLAELAKIGASKVIVKTETRAEYPGELAFTPEAKAPKPEPCAVVAMILEDRSAAVWKIAGGTAIKRAKGLAGPDLSTTGDTIERFAKGCKGSNMFFVSADASVEWGLAYDLAASTRKLEDVKFETLVLLDKTPTAGRKVELSK